MVARGIIYIATNTLLVALQNIVSETILGGKMVYKALSC